MTTQALLSVDDLAVHYRTRRGQVPAVRGISLQVRPGQVTALVGESGSGKSTVAQAAIGLLAANATTTAGSIRLARGDQPPLELLGLSERRWRSVRGPRIGLIPQDPAGSLNPVATIGSAIAEPLRIHRAGSPQTIRRRVLELLERVGLDDPEARFGQYPHELSGGMRQRVLIAAALALEPELIIADEPTSALDVTVQATVLELIDELREASGAGVLLITHDLAVAADRAAEIVVCKDGEVQESGPTGSVLSAPTSDYTKRLLQDAPSLRQVVERAPARSADPLVRVSGLRQEFRRRQGGHFTAVDDISFTVARGSTHALVGESGSGKTTVGRAIAGFQRPTAGRVQVGDTDLAELGSLRIFRRTTQLVYQNPFGSLDPRQTVGAILTEPLRNFGLGDRAEQSERVSHFLDLVALGPDYVDRRPRELSGGQRQRVAIARALILEPELVVLDEAVSALDVTVQAQILRLLARLQAELSLTYVFISHDLAVVRQLADTVSVLQAGRQVEQGTVAEVFDAPQQPYTRRLLDAIPGESVRNYVKVGTDR